LSRDRAIAAALAATGNRERIVSRRALAGGSISGAELLILESGQRVVAKSGAASAAPRFAAEATGLGALGDTDTVAVPEALGVAEAGDSAAIVMSWIEPGPVDAAGWEAFGRDLAALHGADAGTRYGFDSDNHIGATPQANGWMGDWVAFNAERRLLPQVELASHRGVLTGAQRERVETLCTVLDRCLPRTPKPALLHGDLWSGNALPTLAGRVAVIDPAVYVGDGWADIAMMRLFGGFHRRCFDAYAEAVDEHGDVEARIAVYQLYHLLNHANLFGHGYVTQAMSLLSRLGC
jgi:fructosamine-3-kinase